MILLFRYVALVVMRTAVARKTIFQTLGHCESDSLDLSIISMGMVLTTSISRIVLLSLKELESSKKAMNRSRNPRCSVLGGSSAGRPR